MNIRDWFKSTDDIERAQVAEAAGTTVAYLQQLAGFHRLPSRSLAKRLEKATKEITPNMVVTQIEAVFPEHTAA